jgi:formiminotetrahydrofolate cyclodeaminase
VPRGKGQKPEQRREYIRALMDDMPTPSAATMATMFQLSKAEVEAWNFIVRAYMPRRDDNDCEGR